MSLTQRFYPHLVEKKANTLLYGSEKFPGFLKWLNVNFKEDPDELKNFISLTLNYLNVAADFATFYQSVAPFIVDKIPTKEEFEFLAYRLASNYSLLDLNQPIPPNPFPLKNPVVCPLEIIDATVGYNLSTPPRRGIVLLFKIIDGKLCPFTLKRWFPKKFLYILAKNIGLKGRNISFKGYGTELVGMRLLAVVTTSKYTNNLTFEHFGVGQFKGYNVKLYKLRREPCPENIRIPCYRCPRGKDTCPVPARACRQKTITPKDNLCNKTIPILTFHSKLKV